MAHSPDTTENIPSHLAVAVIGAGPAGYYTAEALTRLGPSSGLDVRVDILDRLPTPYGLIRAGVAPDHQTIKRVAARYESTNQQDSVRFVGNLALGRDLTLGELKSLYDVVVLATGAGRDRTLGIDGEELAGVFGSGAFVGWYNGHPDYAGLNPDLNVAAAAVIGNGNVALDVARVLVKSAEEMADSDLAAHAADAIHPNPIRDIYVIGRRGPLNTQFTPKELGEMNRLEKASAILDPACLPDAGEDDDLTGIEAKVIKQLRLMADQDKASKQLRVHFRFFRRPMAILGRERVCGLRLEETRLKDGRAVGTGRTEVLPIGLLVTAIGYQTSPIPDVPFDARGGHFENQDGLIEPGLYCVGWAKRGPTGTIGTNKPDGTEVAERILQDTEQKPPTDKPGRAGLDALIAARGLEIVTFRDWKNIEAAEEAAATGDHPRAKITDIDGLLSAARPT